MFPASSEAVGVLLRHLGIFANVRGFVISKEEKLVSFDGTAHVGASVLRIYSPGLFGSPVASWAFLLNQSFAAVSVLRLYS